MRTTQRGIGSRLCSVNIDRSIIAHVFIHDCYPQTHIVTSSLELSFCHSAKRRQHTHTPHRRHHQQTEMRSNKIKQPRTSRSFETSINVLRNNARTITWTQSKNSCRTSACVHVACVPGADRCAANHRQIFLCVVWLWQSRQIKSTIE